MEGSLLTSRTLAKKTAEFALSKKASDVVLMDLRKLTAPADFFVLCSADSDTHARAIAQAVRDGADGIGASLLRSEGLRALSWVLLDYFDVVVHVFKKDVRQFYNLERLWGDAKVIPMEDTAPVVKVAKAPRKTKPHSKAPRRSKKALSQHR
jgi:ribosome-associated protein